MDNFRQNLLTKMFNIKLNPDEVPLLKPVWIIEPSWVNRPQNLHPYYKGPFVQPLWYQYYCSKEEYHRLSNSTTPHWSTFLEENNTIYATMRTTPFNNRQQIYFASAPLIIEMFDGDVRYTLIE